MRACYPEYEAQLNTLSDSESQITSNVRLKCGSEDYSSFYLGRPTMT